MSSLIRRRVSSAELPPIINSVKNAVWAEIALQDDLNLCHRIDGTKSPLSSNSVNLSAITFKDSGLKAYPRCASASNSCVYHSVPTYGLSKLSFIIWARLQEAGQGCATTFYREFNSWKIRAIYHLPPTLNWTISYGSNEPFTSNLMPIGQWAMIALTCDGAKDKLYVNGELCGSMDYESISWLGTHLNYNDHYNFIFAHNQGYGSNPSIPFKGDLCGYRILDIALSGQQIKDLYNAEK